VSSGISRLRGLVFPLSSGSNNQGNVTANRRVFKKASENISKFVYLN